MFFMHACRKDAVHSASRAVEPCIKFHIRNSISYIEFFFLTPLEICIKFHIKKQFPYTELLNIGIYTMSAIENAFRIIETVVEHQDNGLAFKDIIKSVDLAKSSTHRTLKELNRLGYLLYDGQTKRYRGSLKLSRLGAAVVESIDLRGLTLPFMQQLHEATAHICHFGLLDGRQGVYLHKIESKGHGIRLFSEVGKSFPLHCTAMGKTILAFLPEPAAAGILKGELHAYTDKTITDAGKIVKEFKRIRERGYALDREEITRGLMCVAAPVFDRNGQVIAAVSATFPSFIEKELGLDKELSAVRRCAEQINEALAGKSGY